MPKYYVSQEPENNGVHMVHNEHCDELNTSDDPISLSYHNDMQSAIAKARKLYPKSEKCAQCSGQQYN